MERIIKGVPTKIGITSMDHRHHIRNNFVVSTEAG